MAAPGPDKKLCGAQRLNQPKGTTCKRVAGHGTDHLGTGRCSRHGGSTPTHVASAREQQARAACKRLGMPITTDPGDALMSELAIAEGSAHFYWRLMQSLAKHPVAPEVEEIKGGPQDGAKRLKPGKEAVYMPTYHASGMPTGRAERHILVRMWMEERDRARIAAVEALRLGVAQRLLDSIGESAQRIARAMITFADNTGLDPESPEVREAMAIALRSVATSSSADTVDGTAREIEA